MTSITVRERVPHKEKWQHPQASTSRHNKGTRRMVVINAVGSVILEPWVDHPNVTAVVWAGLCGTEVGNALVDVVYGAQTPRPRAGVYRI